MFTGLQTARRTKYLVRHIHSKSITHLVSCRLKEHHQTYSDLWTQGTRRHKACIVIDVELGPAHLCSSSCFSSLILLVKGDSNRSVNVTTAAQCASRKRVYGSLIHDLFFNQVIHSSGMNTTSFEKPSPSLDKAYRSVGDSVLSLWIIETCEDITWNEFFYFFIFFLV